jgi:surfactin synthase thioesterase subunit
MTLRSPWFPALRERGGEIPLLCLPFAGGASTAYRTWCAPPVTIVPVELPGRGGRFNEPTMNDMGQLADALSEAIRQTFSPPFALFGHSMGATLAFECARRLEQHPPKALVVSGRAPNGRVPPWHRMDDASLVEALRALGGTPQAVLDNAELRALMLPIVRADFAMLSRYEWNPNPCVHVPILALGGDRDPAFLPHELDLWRDATDGSFEARFARGGHFYWTESTDFLDMISRFVSR